jgi:hypothetical protein
MVKKAAPKISRGDPTAIETALRNQKKKFASHKATGVRPKDMCRCSVFLSFHQSEPLLTGRSADISRFRLLVRSGDDLITAIMVRWIRTLGLWFVRKPQDRKPGLNRSRLVGMYLNRANTLERGGPPLMSKPERSDGGFAQGRGR